MELSLISSFFAKVRYNLLAYVDSDIAKDTFKMHRTFHIGQKWVNRSSSHNIFTQSKARQRSGCNLHHGGPASRDLPKRGL